MQFIAFILVYPIIWLISILPFRLLYLFSDFVCFLVYNIFGYRKNVVAGRWVIETRRRRRRWEVIVEPDPAAQLLIVITAYPIDWGFMRERYLDVTFRKGKVLAAYFYLPRNPGEKSQRTERYGEGILIDYGQADRPIGIEFTAPDQISALLQELNQVLTQQNIPPVQPNELIPLLAAWFDIQIQSTTNSNFSIVTTVIRAENLGKKYRIQHQQARQRYTALRDVLADRTSIFSVIRNPHITKELW